MTPEKVIRDGKVAVLISPGYGAGWSTWVPEEHQAMMLFDRRFVEAREAGLFDVEDLAKQIFGDDYVCVLGWETVEIVWLPVGTSFAVEEYDGYESLRTKLDFTA